MSDVKYWIGVVSREHVLMGVKGSFCQVCHGKQLPLSRMKKDDFLIYYSPKIAMDSEEALQKFTAIGRVADDEVYQFQMSQNFVPFRRKISYLKVKEQAIHPLLDKLSFTQEQKNWGAKFRFGIFEISKEDFELIYNKMVE